MKYSLIFLLLSLSYQVQSDEVVKTPLDIVQARMDAYNKHDIHAFLNTYSENIQIFTYPDSPLGKTGKSHIASIFEPMFKEAAVKVKIHNQITQGNYVINHETVIYKDKGTKYVSIYEVVNEKIVSVRFIRN